MTIIFTDTLVGNDPGNSDYTFRVRCPVTSGALDTLTITFESHDSLPSWVDNVGIGKWNGVTTPGSDHNCTAVPTELLFSTNGLANGGHGFHMPLLTTILCDPLTIAGSAIAGFTSSDRLIICIDFSSTNGNGRANTTTATGATVAYAAGNSYNTQNLSTGALFNWSYMPRLIETTGVAATPTIGLRSRIQLGH